MQWELEVKSYSFFEQNNQGCANAVSTTRGRPSKKGRKESVRSLSPEVAAQNMNEWRLEQVLELLTTLWFFQVRHNSMFEIPEQGLWVSAQDYYSQESGSKVHNQEDGYQLFDRTTGEVVGSVWKAPAEGPDEFVLTLSIDVKGERLFVHDLLHWPHDLEVFQRLGHDPNRSHVPAMVSPGAGVAGHQLVKRFVCT